MDNILFNKTEKVSNFNWGGYKEFILNLNSEIQITNMFTGLQNSSFELKDKEYNIIVSKTKIDGKEITFEGIPKLSGSEEDNLFMEEIEEGFKRIFFLNNKKLIFNSSLFDNTKYIYVYLS